MKQGLQFRRYMGGVQRVQPARFPAADFISHPVEGPHATADGQPDEDAQQRHGQKQRREQGFEHLLRDLSPSLDPFAHMDEVFVLRVPGREHAPAAPVNLPLAEAGVRAAQRRVRCVRRVERQAPSVFPDLEGNGIRERPAELHVLGVELLHLVAGLRHQQRHRLGQVGVE